MSVHESELSDLKAVLAELKELQARHEHAELERHRLVVASKAKDERIAELERELVTLRARSRDFEAMNTWQASRLGTCREAFQAISEEGWMFCGPEGPTEAQQKIIAAWGLLRDVEEHAHNWTEREGDTQNLYCECGEVSRPLSPVVEGQAPDPSITEGPLCPGCSPMHRVHTAECKFYDGYVGAARMVENQLPDCRVCGRAVGTLQSYVVDSQGWRHLACSSTETASEGQ